MKTIIEMAREAGLPEAWISETGVLKWSDLERFAELVRADERDCVMNEPITKAHWQRFENDIRADERESTAKFFDGKVGQADLRDIAATIRARGNT